MKNSEIFTDIFHEIEGELKKRAKITNNIPFFQLIEEAKKTELRNFINRYESDLKTYANLRNVIIHKRTKQVLAEPSDEAVNKIRDIRDTLFNIKSVSSIFKKHVTTLNKDEVFQKALAIMKEMDYSQIPLYDGEKQFVGLLNANSITMWLADNVDLGLVDLSDISIGGIYDQYQANKQNFKFISKEKNIYDVAHEFKRHIDEKIPELDAILITDNGKKSGNLIGIVTAWDLIELDL